VAEAMTLIIRLLRGVWEDRREQRCPLILPLNPNLENGGRRTSPLLCCCWNQLSQDLTTQASLLKLR
jgi:hypothetical protein